VQIEGVVAMKCPKCGSDMQRTGTEEVKNEKEPGESYPEAVQRTTGGVLVIKSYRCPMCGYDVCTAN
jgi:predicted RNA-binding Zn-ribbon protein involved in translation (DUF1610 family)